MFAASNDKKGIAPQELQPPDPRTKRGLTDVEKYERKGSKHFQSGPKTPTRTHTTTPDAIQVTKKIFRGTKTGATESTMSIVFLAIESVVSARDEKRIKKILLRLWKQAAPEMRQRITAIVANLSEILSSGEGRILKRLKRHHDHDQQALLLAGFLHAVKPGTLRRIGLKQIADIVDYEQPTGLMQCLLHGVVESERAKDRAMYLVLLDLIRGKSFELKDEIALCCLALDLIDAAERQVQLSAEILVARDQALGILQAIR